MKTTTKNFPLKEQIDSSLLGRLGQDILLIETQADAVARESQKMVVGICQNLEAKDLISLAQRSGLRHLTQNSKTKFIREMKLASVLTLKPVEFLNDPLSFILSSDRSVERLQIPFRNSKNRDEALDLIVKFLLKIPGGEMLKDSVRILSDELFTNALYNAPTDANGRHQHAHFPRTQSVELKSTQTARISIAFDQERVVLLCEDPFGSLDEEKFIAGLVSKYNQSDDLTPVNMGPGGAGIGCRMLFDRSTELFIVCQKGTKTFFGCGLPLGVSARELERTPKNLHLAFFE